MLDLVEGFKIALHFTNLLACFIGVLVGTLVGVLPGIGPTAAIAILLPITFKITPVAAIIMLAGIYYGAMYGGSTTSILVNIPGEAASVVTTLDGYQMARQGRAGPALGIAAFGSFIAGTLSVIGLMVIAEPLAKVAIRFGPPEYFALVCFGLVIVANLTGGSVLNGVMMGLLGLLLSFIGLDTISGLPRFNFGMMEFMDGIDLVPLLMGLFGVSEVLVNLGQPDEKTSVIKTAFRDMFPSRKDWGQSIGAIGRGSVVGFFLGILPGGGATISSFVSYWLERKISRHPEKFGTGAIQGVAAPESANNAGVGGSFIPLMILGIPTNAIIAMLMGALMIHGVKPGPDLISKYPDIFWGFVASMYIGNALLLFLNLPLIPVWVQILRVPYRVLFPLILLFTIIGAYSVKNSVFDIGLTVFFGLVGYFLKRYGFQAAPLVMAFVLGQMLEESLRQSLIMSQGNFSIFLYRPFCLAFLVFTLLFMLFSLIPGGRKLKQVGETEQKEPGL